MTLVKLTLLTDDNMNGVPVWFHTDELRRVMPLQNGSAVLLLNGDSNSFQESTEQIIALVNGSSEAKVDGRTVAARYAKQVNKNSEQKTQETGE